MMDGSPPETGPPRPHNIEAEQAVLGALLINNEAHGRLTGVLEPEHFYDPVHARIYETAMEWIGQGRLASAVTLKTVFEADEGLHQLGGPLYFVRLAEAVLSVTSVRDYAQVLVKLAARRQMIAAAESAIAQAADPNCDPQALLDDVSAELDQMREQTGAPQRLMSMGTVLAEAAKMTEDAFKDDGGGFRTGLADLDTALGGLYPGDLTVIGARPGMGKSALAACLMQRQMDHPQRASLFMSLEMLAAQNALRMVSAWLKTRGHDIAYKRFRKGDMTHDEFMAFLRVAQDKERLSLWWTGPEVRNITAIEAEAGRYRRLAEARGLEPGPIVIDYLNLIRGPDNLSAYERISLITARLKELALRLHVPVILLAQLSRAVEQREDKRPVLSDLRDSSSIEQDADNILFLYRDAYYAEREKPADSAPEDKHQAWSARVAKAADTLEIILAKVRSGETSTVRVGVDLANNHFWDLGRSA